MKRKILAATIFLFSTVTLANDNLQPKLVKFTNGKLKLGGELYLPQGEGPFPTLLFNHGSAPKMKNSFASKAIAPKFLENGWAFFMPYRRGQGLSEDQGPYIIDEIKSARWKGWGKAAKRLVELHRTDHLSDQLAAFAWLKEQDFVDKQRIATMGNSFGGIQVVLGAENADYCAAVSASGAAQSWSDAKELRYIMKSAVSNSKSPMLFFQAENDYDLTPTRVLSRHMKEAGKDVEVKIYPPFGTSAKQAHSFPWTGVEIWFPDIIAFMSKHCGSSNA